MELVVLLVIVIIIGALLGAKTLGGTIRTGCGCITLGLILIGAVLFFGILMDQDDDEYFNFIVNQYSEIYSEPNIDSDVIGYVDEGEEVYVENTERFNYFYEVESDFGTIYYILKENLSRKESSSKDVKQYTIEEAEEFVADYYSFYDRDVQYRGVKIRRVGPNEFKVSVEECSMFCEDEISWDAKVYDLEVDHDGDYTYKWDYY